MEQNDRNRIRLMGERLDKLIKETEGMSGKILAERLGVSPSYVSMWRTGERPIPTLELHKICKIFSCSMGYLTGEDEINEWKNIGKRIANIRKVKGFDILQFCRVLGITPASLSEIETGRREPSRNEIEKIIDVLGIEFHQLEIDYEEKIEQIKKICEEIGVSDSSIEGIIAQIKFDIFE